MNQNGMERVIVYANETTISAGKSDSTMIFRWVVPEFNENNEIIGKKVEKEVVISMTTDLLKDNADKSLSLLARIDELLSSESAEPQQPGR